MNSSLIGEAERDIRMKFGEQEKRQAATLPSKREEMPQAAATNDREPLHTALHARSGRAISKEDARQLESLLKEVRPMQKADLTKVSPDVLLAQHLSHEQEKTVYFAMERYRLLSTRLLQVTKNTRSKIFLITSAIAEEGKTLTSANLAFALSGASSQKILLIDLDLRRPSMARTLGIQAIPGAVSYLEAEDWRSTRWELKPNLHALILDKPAGHPDEAAHSEAVRKIMEQAKSEYDVIIVDSAPLLLAVDTHVILGLVDQALLVVRADHTPINCSQDAARMMGEKGMGCIFNDVKKMKYEEYYKAYYK